MSSSIGASTDRASFYTIRDDVSRLAGKKPARPEARPRKGVITEYDVKTDVTAGLKSVGIDVGSIARKVDTDGDTRITASELARVQASQNAALGAKLDSNGDGRVTKAEVTSNADRLAKSRDTNGDGKVSKQENVDAAKKLADQLDSDYGYLRPKGFSRDDVYSQRGAIVANGGNGTVLAGRVAYEASVADRNGDGMINSSEAKDYVDSKTGISDDIKKFEKNRDAEKTKKAEETKKSDEARESKKSDEARDSRKSEETRKAEKEDDQRSRLQQAYVGAGSVSRSSLSVSA